MKKPPSSHQQSVLEGVLSKLTSPYVIGVMGGLFLLDVAIPDLIPVVDEVMLFLATLLLARWRKRRQKHADQMGTKPPPKDVTPVR
jgi:hypothetical protein